MTLNLWESLACSRQKDLVPVVAEIKRVIPKLANKLGRDERDAAHLARCYQIGGASGISLVTERKHFGGQPEIDIPAVLQATSLPLLIKDFILAREQIDYYAKLASAVNSAWHRRVTLLLTAHLVKEQLPDLLQYVHAQGMLALVETRGPADLPYLANLVRPPRIVGINNKNIDELEMGEDLIRVNQEMLAAYRPVVGEALILSESAHQGPEDVQRSLTAGADAVLAGTAFLIAADPASTVASFVQARRRFH